MTLASPLRRFIARGSSSIRRVSMQVSTTSFLSGKASVRNGSYSRRSTKRSLWDIMSDRMDMVVLPAYWRRRLFSIFRSRWGLCGGGIEQNCFDAIEPTLYDHSEGTLH